MEALKQMRFSPADAWKCGGVGRCGDQPACAISLMSDDRLWA